MLFRSHLRDSDDMYRFLLSIILVVTFLVNVIIGAFFAQFMTHYVTIIAALLLGVDVFIMMHDKAKHDHAENAAS